MIRRKTSPATTTRLLGWSLPTHDSCLEEEATQEASLAGAEKIRMSTSPFHQRPAQNRARSSSSDQNSFIKPFDHGHCKIPTFRVPRAYGTPSKQEELDFLKRIIRMT
jgi:hypothetical protein